MSGFVVGGRSTGLFCWMAKPGCVDLGWARGAELRMGAPLGQACWPDLANMLFKGVGHSCLFLNTTGYVDVVLRCFRNYLASGYVGLI